ncbi:uncharacterized protein LOC135143472 isoform X2 [Zophobas morio]|uniref:uncharacterized protein LOC135143472 isoform X2 n=1 Tax=Zophobas morio TaxID=2755281 RepID=UPI0030828D02
MSMLEMNLNTGSFWIALYLLTNVGLSVYSKVVLTSFKFPWTLSAVHVLISGLGAAISIYIFNSCQLNTLRKEQVPIWLGFSFLYTMNIAVSNVALERVSLPFHQIIRSTNPVVTSILEYFIFRRLYSEKTYLSLIPVVLGVGIASRGELRFNISGLLFTLLSVLLASLKGIISNMLMVGDTNVHPIELVYRMSIPAGIQCVIFCALTGEASGVLKYIRLQVLSNYDHLELNMLWILLFNGLLAFVLNVVSFTANKKTGALSMTVAGNSTQVLCIIASVLFLKYVLTMWSLAGVTLTIAGSLTYREQVQRLQS